MLRMFVSVLLVLLTCHAVFGNEDIYIVSIVDSTSVLSCFIKVYSVLKSSTCKERFVFKFLLLDTESILHLNGENVIYKESSISINKWDMLFTHYFPDIRYESKVWHRPKTLPKLRETSFEKEYIYARFYLPLIFDDIHKYIYLDNDMVVTGDLKELWNTPLKVSAFVNTNNLVEQRPAVIDKRVKSKTQENRLQRITGIQTLQMRNNRNGGDLGTDDSRERVQSAEMLRKPPPPQSFKPAVGFVYERHKYYNQYMYDHFNSSHPIMRKLRQEMLSSLFFNAGVAVVDCILWRARGMTQEAERLIALNQPSWIKKHVEGEVDAKVGAENNPNPNPNPNHNPNLKSNHTETKVVEVEREIETGNTTQSLTKEVKEVVIYDDAAGDQGLFYILLGNRVSYLHAKWNMRRLPMKTVHMLTNTLATGIIHFAGTTHGDGLFFCKAPLQYPIFVADVVPLYLSIASAFANYMTNLTTNTTVISITTIEIEALTDSYLSIPSDKCNDAIKKIQREHRLNYRVSENNLILKGTPTSKIIPGRFNPGLNKNEFTWPPLKPFPLLKDIPT